MVAGALHPGGAGTPVNAGFGPIIAIFVAMLAMGTVCVTQVALQALPRPIHLRQRLLGSLLARLLTGGWFLSLLFLLAVALAAGLYGLYVN